jgi:hypothetical protein
VGVVYFEDLGVVSEQAVVGHATDVMCSRFLSGSQRISTHLSWLREHAEEINADARTSVRAAAEKIEIAQRHLTAQMDRLPAAQWERFKSMLKLLRAQQDVLDSVEALMQRARANIVRQRLPDPVEDPAMGSFAPTISEPGRSDYPSDNWSSKPVIRGAVSLRLALVGMLAAGLAIGYVMIPRGGARQEMASKPTAMARAGSGARATSLPVSKERAPAMRGSETATPSIRTASAGDSPADAMSLHALPPTEPAPATLPTPMPSGLATANASGAPATAPHGERFVPVVFTDKEQARVLQAFAELQVRYPKLLRQRRAEAQPVDVGHKGIWHRLIVLPPGSRQSAAEFCDQLQAAGYEWCWVKGY